VTVKVVATGMTFRHRELVRLRALRNFYVGMRWVASNIIEPRVAVFEVVDHSAFPLIFEDVSAVIQTPSDFSWNERL